MKIVLVQNVPKLGKRGEVVAVADGYARNYLIPRGLALEATPANLKRFEAEQAAAKRRAEREAAEAQAAAEQLEGLRLTVKAKAGEEGRLFGSVTAKDIAESIKEATGLDIDRKRIEIEEPLKALGDHRVTVRLSPEIAREITVTVEALEE
ncbi:MAG TPA: 50S ribosomal protein L9 [Clostridiales bacterium]|nr:50S ribosomal protein L9 [Clostridiales bacterium]